MGFGGGLELRLHLQDVLGEALRTRGTAEQAAAEHKTAEHKTAEQREHADDQDGTGGCTSQHVPSMRGFRESSMRAERSQAWDNPFKFEMIGV